MEDMIKQKKIKNKKMDLIVLRVTKNGKLSQSAPCFHCTFQLSNSNLININRLYYSASENTIDCIKFSDWISKGTNHVSKSRRHKCN